MATSEAHATRNGDYVDTGRVHTYYEVNGSGDPLILLHGGMCTAETFDGQTPALAEHFRVYVPERRAHGRTADVAGPITYEIMAQDTIAFIEAAGHRARAPRRLERRRARRAARRALATGARRQARPDRRRAVNLEEHAPRAGGDVAGLMTEAMVPPPLHAAYEALSPDGPDAPRRRARQDAGAVEHRSGVRAQRPRARRGADARPRGRRRRDALDRARGRDAARAARRRSSRSCPGPRTGVPMEKPELVNRLILDFLAEDQVEQRFKL